MNRVRAFHVLRLALFVACGAAAPTIAGCSSSTTGTGTGDGGTTSTGTQTTFSCLVEDLGASPTCEYYEATGADAASAIAIERSQCVTVASEKETIIDACPTANNLGGCKTPVTVQGGSAQVTVTRFAYKSDTGFQTSEAVKSNCTAPNASYVPAP